MPHMHTQCGLYTVVVLVIAFSPIKNLLFEVLSILVLLEVATDHDIFM